MEQLTIFSPRLIKLLILLVDQEDFVAVQYLADKLGTSKRTLFREISGCNQLLMPINLKLESKVGLGIRLEGSKEDKDRLLKTLIDYQSTLGYFDKEQRRMMLTAELLKNKSIVKLIYFAQLFDVSEATISNDMDLLQDWFSRYNLSLNRKPGLGIFLEGSEEDIRKAMTDYVHAQLEENKLMDLIYMHRDRFDFEDYFIGQNKDSILNLLNRKILFRVVEVLKENKESYLNKMAESSFIGLVIHLTIAVERLMNHESITIETDLFLELKDDEDYDKAKILAEYIEDEFNITFPDAEIVYILMHLKGAKSRYLEPHSSTQVQTIIRDFDIKILVEKMIRAYEQITGLALFDDDILHSGLITHLRPALTRMMYKLEIRNPLLKQIQTQYSEVYQHSTQACRSIENDINHQIPDDEVGYIALHFGAAIERLKQKSEKNMLIRVGVVCASGIGISSLLSSRLKTLFPDLHTVMPLSVEDIVAGIEQQVDLLVCTLEIKQSYVASVYVHPLLPQEDIENIRVALSLLKQHRYDQPEASDQEIVDQLVMMQVVNDTVKQLINQFEIVEISDKLTIDEMIRTCASHVSNDLGIIEKLVSDLKYRESLGSIILPLEKVMLLHAKTTAIHEPVLRIFLPRKGEFKDEQAKGSMGILLMLVGNPPLKEQTSILSYVSQTLIESPRLSDAIKAKNKNDILKEIHRILKQWFKNETLKRVA